jgi:hypothetical protein
MEYTGARGGAAATQPPRGATESTCGMSTGADAAAGGMSAGADAPAPGAQSASSMSASVHRMAGSSSKHALRSFAASSAMPSGGTYAAAPRQHCAPHGRLAYTHCAGS